jgi:DivIVA domain-containing protein
MIDLTPLDVRKKKGDFRRAVRGYDTELVDDFLDMVAERLEELVKQNVALTERAEHLEEQVASYRERERALNEALVTAQQLRNEARAQADREAELVRREAQSQAERIVEEGQRSYRELARQMEELQARKMQFLRAFRTLLERYLSELEMEEARLGEALAGFKAIPDNLARPSGTAGAETTQPADPPAEPPQAKQGDWLSSLVGDGEQEEKDR